MPSTIENQRVVVTRLDPREGKKNPSGNGQLIPLVFHLPGPVTVEPPCDKLPSPYDLRIKLVQISYTVGSATVKLHGVPAEIAGPYTGAFRFSPDEELVDPIEQGAQVWVEVTVPNESAEGLIVMLVCSPIL